jgi:hypothetical protein
VAQCVVIDGSGALVADPSPIDTCTGYVLATSQEFANMQTVWTPLTLDEGTIIGGAIFLAWAVAWGFRMIGSLIAEADA